MINSPIVLSLDNYNFPDANLAMREPDGLLAIGGDLSAERIVNAYTNGIFPWFSEEDPILWWSPNPRAVLFPSDLHISRSLQKDLRKRIYTTTKNHAFETVIKNCATVCRKEQNGTWIIDPMQRAYINLYNMGIAHSIEVWSNQQLVGGLYGLKLGKVFFGESMFHIKTNASKVAMVSLVQWLLEIGVELVDCQVSSTHLNSLGAQSIPRSDFLALLNRLI